MRGLRNKKVALSSIACALLISAFTSGCSTSTPPIGSCELLTQHSPLVGTALAWKVNETQYLGYGIYVCDVPSEMRIEPIEDPTGAYVYAEGVATFGDNQSDFRIFGSELPHDSKFFESVKQVMTNQSIELKANQKVQLFMATKPTKEALIYGVERHHAKVTFYTLDGKVIKTFRPIIDTGILAQPQKY